MEYQVVKKTLQNGNVIYVIAHRRNGEGESDWREFPTAYQNIDEAMASFLIYRGQEPVETEVVIPHDADYSKEPATSDINQCAVGEPNPIFTDNEMLTIRRQCLEMAARSDTSHDSAVIVMMAIEFQRYIQGL